MGGIPDEFYRNPHHFIVTESSTTRHACPNRTTTHKILSFVALVFTKLQPETLVFIKMEVQVIPDTMLELL